GVRDLARGRRALHGRAVEFFDFVEQPGFFGGPLGELAADPAVDKKADDQRADEAGDNGKESFAGGIHCLPPSLADVLVDVAFAAAGVFAAAAFEAAADASACFGGGRSCGGAMVTVSSKDHCSHSRSVSCEMTLPLTVCCLSRRLSSSCVTRSDVSVWPTNLMNPPPPLGMTWIVISLTSALSGGGIF